MDFPEFIAPMPVGEFMAGYFGQRPLRVAVSTHVTF